MKKFTAACNEIVWWAVFPSAGSFATYEIDEIFDRVALVTDAENGPSTFNSLLKFGAQFEFPAGEFKFCFEFH